MQKIKSLENGGLFTNVIHISNSAVCRLVNKLYLVCKYFYLNRTI